MEVSSTPSIPAPLFTESELLRKLGVSVFIANRLRRSGVLKHDHTAQGGRMRLYDAARLPELAAKIKPQPSAA